MIKHVSFDVWNTLITANPHFALARNFYLATELNIGVDIIKQMYTRVKDTVDSGAVFRCEAFSTDEVFRLLYNALNITVTPTQHKRIRAAIESLFLTHTPCLGIGVKQLLHALIDDGITVGIGSNSNFISGAVMLPFLERELDVKFTAPVFSDLCGHAKPDPQFFVQIMDQLTHVTTNRHEVLHVGDSVDCDVVGADRVGIYTTVIHGPDHLQAAVMASVTHFRHTH